MPARKQRIHRGQPPAPGIRHTEKYLHSENICEILVKNILITIEWTDIVDNGGGGGVGRVDPGDLADPSHITPVLELDTNLREVFTITEKAHSKASHGVFNVKALAG